MKFNFLLAPPTDDDGGKVIKEVEETTNVKEEEVTKEEDGFVAPKFFSQFKHDRRDTEDYKTFVGKYENLTDMADRLVNLEKSSKNAISIPDENASHEEVEKFLNKLGVPMDANEYKFEKSIVDTETEKQLKESLVPQFHKLGLTMRQANGMMKLMENNYIESVKSIERQIEDKKNNFETRFSNSFSDVSENETARNEYSKKMFTYATNFLAKSNLLKEFKETGLMFEPKIMRKLAEYEKKNAKPTHIEEKGTDNSEKKGFIYGKAFQNFIEGLNDN